MCVPVRYWVAAVMMAGLVGCGGDAGGGGDEVVDASSAPDAEPNASDAEPVAPDSGPASAVSFTLVDTGLDQCYGQTNAVISCPAPGAHFYGQDAQYDSATPSYELAADDTAVLDRNTGLMWERAHHTGRVTFSEAAAACDSMQVGGYDDWRLPGITELFSLADFRGEVGGRFYLDSDYFDFAIPTEGDLSGTHSYEMMGQTWSATARPDDSTRGYYFFNFLDGHIKSAPSNPMFELFYRCVRGDSVAFTNEYVTRAAGTVSDLATGRMWQAGIGEQSPGDRQFVWQEALSYCEQLSLAGHDDWRLPDVKELQSIVDYTSPDPAIDTSLFTQEVVDGTGAFFWSSTSMINYPDWATYVCFGPCLSHTGQDIHGPGAQRADPKWENGVDFSQGVGDQRDVVQIHNYVRCVRTE